MADTYQWNVCDCVRTATGDPQIFIPEFFFMSTIQAFFSIGIYYFYFISNNNCRLLTTVQVFDIILDTSWLLIYFTIF
jgi:hypothetical protein